MAMSRASIDAILTQITATGRIFDPAATFVKLFTAGPTGPGVAGTEFTFPAALAFAGVAITTWGAIQHLNDGRSAKASPAITFVPGSSADAATIIGFALGTDADMTVVKEYVLSPESFSLADEFHPLSVVVRLCMGERVSFDDSKFING